MSPPPQRPLIGRFVLSIVAAAAGVTILRADSCNYTTKEDDTAGIGLESDVEWVEPCVGSFSSFTLIDYSEISAACVTGEGPDAPSNFELAVPANSGDYAAYPVSTDYNDGTFQFLIMHGTPNTPLLSHAGEDGYNWGWSHDPECEDYDVTGFDLAVIDGQLAYWAFVAEPDCDGQLPPPPPPAPSGRVPSGPQTCTAGEADFTMVTRRVIRDDGTKATVWAVPVIDEDTVFPERAWMRSVEVTDWGAATNLHIADFTSPLSVDGWGLDGSVISSAGSDTITFAVGEVPMTAMMGSAEIPLDGETLALPTLHIEWTCEMNPTTPHAIAVPGHSGHAIAFPSASGLEGRVVFWVASDGGGVRIAPEGRYLDYVESELTTSGSGGKTFSVRLTAYDLVFTGRLVPFGGSFKLHDGVVTVAGTPTNISTQTLSAL